MDNGFLPVLELYGRYSKEGEMFLTGAFGGVRIFIYPIEGAHPDDRCWRMYFAPRQVGVDRDRARATAVTTPAPTGWDSVHERRRAQVRRNVGLKDTLAAVGFPGALLRGRTGITILRGPGGAGKGPRRDLTRGTHRQIGQVADNRNSAPKGIVVWGRGQEHAARVSPTGRWITELVRLHEFPWPISGSGWSVTNADG